MVNEWSEYSNTRNTKDLEFTSLAKPVIKPKPNWFGDKKKPIKNIRKSGVKWI